MGVAASARVRVRLAWWQRWLNAPLVGVVRVYRVVGSPIVGGQCRFSPTCSVYALEALRVYGPVRGSWMAMKRIGRCGPWSKGGLDPVPIPEGAVLIGSEVEVGDGGETPGGEKA
jgi:hypothetical protein